MIRARPQGKDTTVRLAILIAMLCVACGARADDWADGNAAFARGDYAAALASFEAARDAGMGGPAVHYNIAACQYKLELFDEADDTFSYIGREFPALEGLAQYNLGLVAQQSGDMVDAERHFLMAYRLSLNDEKVRILASNQLAEIETEIPPESRWAGAFGARAGYDDNVALRDTSGIPLGVTTESPMLDIFASVAGPYSDSGEGLRIEGSLYAIRYLDADEFDQNEINVGGLYEWRPSEWRIQFGANVAAGWLGGDPFDRRLGFSINVSRYLGDSASVGLAWYYDDISEGDNVFAGIAGKRSHLIARYRWFSSDGRRVLLRLRHEQNDRQDPGVSPTRTELSADYRYQPDRGWGFEAGASYRRSRFSDLVTPRNEDLWSARFGLARTVFDDWTLLIEYRFSDNDSNDPTFSYDRNVLTAGMLRTF